MGNTHSADNIFNITKVKENMQPKEVTNTRSLNNSTKNQRSGSSNSKNDEAMIVQKFDVDDESFDENTQALFRKTDRPKSPDSEPLTNNISFPKGKSTVSSDNKTEAKNNDYSRGWSYLLIY